MTEFTEEEQKELSNILDEIEQKVKETRPKCTEDWQLEILDEVERELSRKKK